MDNREQPAAASFYREAFYPRRDGALVTSLLVMFWFLAGRSVGALLSPPLTPRVTEALLGAAVALVIVVLDHWFHERDSAERLRADLLLIGFFALFAWVVQPLDLHEGSRPSQGIVRDQPT